MKIIITGMHRCGTSMISGLLGLCGGYHGNNLISGLRDNPKGHFEDREFVAINDYILRINGGSWKMPPATITKCPVNRMRRFLGKWPTDKPVILKDPRACFTIGVWRQLIGDQNLRVLFVMRSARAIADSLAARNRMPHALSHDLTKQYGAAFADNMRNRKYVTTSYAAYFTNAPVPWQTELSRVCDALDLEIPVDIEPIEKFIEPRLRHRG